MNAKITLQNVYSASPGDGLPKKASITYHSQRQILLCIFDSNGFDFKFK
jgi:hypothetical protein